VAEVANPGTPAAGPRAAADRLRGCLLWIVAVVLLVLVLALVFGGFQHGTKAGLGPLAAMAAGYHP
jgi:hypothetical protein